MGSLTYYLVLRMILLVSLNLTYHRNIVFHSYIVVNVNFQIVVAGLGVCQFCAMLAAIFLREVEEGWRYEIVKASIGAVIVVVIECCGACTPIATDQGLVRYKRMVLAQFSADLFWVFSLAMLELDIVIGGPTSPPSIRTFPHSFTIEH